MKHDTKFHVPVGQQGEEASAGSPGVTVCEAHQKTLENLFDSMKGYMSKAQTVWTITILSAVAVFYGVTLWTTVTARCNESDARIDAIKNQVTIQEVKLQYIEAAVTELKAGQKEALIRLEELHKEMRRLNNRP